MNPDRSGQMWHYEGGPAPQVRTKLILVLGPGKTKDIWICLCVRDGERPWKMDMHERFSSVGPWESVPDMTRIG